mgnify:FL=1
MLLIVACGKTPEEKQEVAIVSCNILEASLGDASQRIKEINRAREELNEPPFLGKEDEITQAIKYNLCKELVLNDELYEESLFNAIEQENEASRIAYEKSLEEERKKIKEWADKNKEIVAKITPLKFVKFANFYSECYNTAPRKLEEKHPLVICTEINNFSGFVVTWEVIFKNGYTHIDNRNTIIVPYMLIYDFYLDDKTLIDLENSNSLKEHVDEVNIYVTNMNTKYSEDNNLLYSEMQALSNNHLNLLEFSDETLGIKYQIYPSISD